MEKGAGVEERPSLSSLAPTSTSILPIPTPTCTSSPSLSSHTLLHLDSTHSPPLSTSLPPYPYLITTPTLPLTLNTHNPTLASHYPYPPYLYLPNPYPLTFSQHPDCYFTTLLPQPQPGPLPSSCDPTFNPHALTSLTTILALPLHALPPPHPNTLPKLPNLSPSYLTSNSHC